MLDLEKEVKKAFEKLAKENDMPINKYWCDDGTDNQYEHPETSDAYNFYRDGWNKREELAQAEITALKQKIKGLKDLNIDLQYSRQRVRVELSDLDGVLTELKQKLARYENPDYVLVPRELTESMRKEGREQIEYGKLCADAVYEAMIEAVEKGDE